MRFLQNIRRVRRLMSQDVNAHLGDIALLKMDAVGLDIRPSLRDALAPVRGYAPRLDFEALRRLPEGTFGRATARFFDEHHLSPIEITPEIDAQTLARNAYGLRYAATHDLFHVLLGVGPDKVGEMEVLAFTVGQGYHRLLWMQAAFAWLLYPIQSGLRLGALMAAWRRGYALGRRAPMLLGLRLEDRFEADLGALRAELGLTDAPRLALA